MKKIQVLGPGCPSCDTLAELAQQAAGELAIEFEFEKVSDMDQILAFNVPTTPALIVNGEVMICGRVPTLTELKSMIGGVT
jgi:small redox-active disulfide protein 2